MSNVKRLFLYAVTATGLIFFAWGSGTLLTLVFDLITGGESWREAAQYQLSLGLAMLIIGGILWFVFWRIVQRAAADNPAETGSGIRKLYINLILVIASVMAITGFAGFIGWIIGDIPFSGFPSDTLAVSIVTVILWVYHSRIEAKEGQISASAKTLRRWYVYILSAFTLISLVTNVVMLINTSVTLLPFKGGYTTYDGNWIRWLSESLGWIIIISPAWWFFWFREAKNDLDSTLRQVYLYLLTITGGAIAFLVAVTNILYQLFSLALVSSADTDFTFLGWAIPTALISAAVWVYHRKVAQEEAGKAMADRFSPHRLYLYLMSFIGLGTMLSGIVYLFSVLIDLLIDSVSNVTVYTSGWWSGQLSYSLALLLTGIPLWLYCWRKVLKFVDEGGVAERSTVSRRIYVYAVLGISIIAAVVTLVMVIYQSINGILQGEFSRNALSGIIWSLSVFLTSIPVLVYHWRLLREDQSLGAEKTGRRKKVTVIIGEDKDDLVKLIEKQLGYRVKRQIFTGMVTGEISAIDEKTIDKLSTDISEADGSGVILDITGKTVRMIPYRDE